MNKRKNLSFLILLLTLSIIILSIGVVAKTKGYLYFGLGLGLISLLIYKTNKKLFDKLLNLWLIIGEILRRFFSPVIWGIIYYIFITPFALIMRLNKRDELGIRKNIVASTWKDYVNDKRKDYFNDQF